MPEAMPMDDDEDFMCDKCEKKIIDWNDLVQISVVDEETEDEIEEETLCAACAKIQ
jgi:hypothetical protein